MKHRIRKEIMGTSVLHIKTEVECKVFLFDEEKGVATIDKYFNLEVRKGEQELLFVSTANSNLQCEKKLQIDEADSNYKLYLTNRFFVVNRKSKEEIELKSRAKSGDAQAQYDLAEQYYRSGNSEEAKRWYSIASENGNVEAMLRMGKCLFYGENDGYNFPPDYRGDESSEYGQSYDYWEKAKKVSNDYNLKEICNYNIQLYDLLYSRYWWKHFVLFHHVSENRRFKYEKDYEDIDYFDLHHYWNALNEKKNEYAITPPYFLFFDTETTGLPKNYDEPASNTKNWPRLVQLAWILTDAYCRRLSSHCMIVKPDGFSIPFAAEDVHGISTSVALQKGRPLREVITAFLKDAKLAKYFVGHNISFDQNVVGAELHRLGINDTISTAPAFCTMKETVDFCALECDDDCDEMIGYKYPSLQELHMKLFNKEFDNAHDAMADVSATLKCFYFLSVDGDIIPYPAEEDFPRSTPLTDDELANGD